MPEPRLDEYGFEPHSGRYRSLTTGQYVKTADIQALVEAEIQAGFVRLGTLADKVASGQATTQQLQDATISHLRNSHITMYALGRGGVRQLGESDFQTISASLEKEYIYLENFMSDIENGNLSAAQIKARLNLYEGGVWTSYNDGELASAQQAGYTEERRIAVDDKGTCDDCKDYEKLGWQPIGTLPSPGQASICGHNCRCRKEYRIGKTAQKGRVRLSA